MIQLAILIPTLRRPESLKRALRSVFAQDAFVGEAAVPTEIVVIDNSPEGSAVASVDALRSVAPVPLVYVHEPRPGVATARNAGLAATRASHIAFIDDDEEAPPHWLAALLDIHMALAADVTFGPVQGIAADAAPRQRAYLERFFSRVGPDRSGTINDTFGCGNSLMTRATALPGSRPFDSAADQTGGEDDRLFTALKARGARFAWAAEAVVYEHAPAHRAKVSYALTRAMGFGQSPSQICARAGDPIGVAKWMIIGLAQATIYGAIAGMLWLARQPSRYAFADRAARGLGKVFWTSFLTFYGAAEARRSSRPSSASAGASGVASLTASTVKISQNRSL